MSLEHAVAEARAIPDRTARYHILCRFTPSWDLRKEYPDLWAEEFIQAHGQKGAAEWLVGQYLFPDEKCWLKDPVQESYWDKPEDPALLQYVVNTKYEIGRIFLYEGREGYAYNLGETVRGQNLPSKKLVRGAIVEVLSRRNKYFFLRMLLIQRALVNPKLPSPPQPDTPRWYEMLQNGQRDNRPVWRDNPHVTDRYYADEFRIEV